MNRRREDVHQVGEIGLIGGLLANRPQNLNGALKMSGSEKESKVRKGEKYERPGFSGPLKSLLVATLVTSLAQKFTVLLLRHALATLFDNGPHGLPPNLVG